MPHSLVCPTPESIRPITGYGVLGYPLLGVGSLIALAGLLHRAVRAVADR